MAIDPRLGYDPSINAPNSAGAQTVQQWQADTALSMMMEFVNATGGVTSPLMSAALWQQAGIPLPDQNLIGTSAKNPDNSLPPTLYASFMAMAKYLSANPQVAQANGLTVPPTTSAAPLSPDDQTRIAAATAAAASNQNNVDVANIQGQTSRDVAGINAQTSRDVATIGADASRYGADIQKQIADANTAESARQFNITTAETKREFDLSQAEDRRQFNATLLSNLLDTATQWAKNPVDWVAHQFYMANMGVPLTAANFLAAANVVGAIPPSGPSNVGPVVGGPAVIDGDHALAAQLGVQPGIVSVAQAVAANPGTGGVFQQNASWTSQATLPQVAASVGGVQQLDQLVDRSRLRDLPPEIQQSPAFQSWQASGGAIPRPISTAAASMPELPVPNGSRRAGGGVQPASDSGGIRTPSGATIPARAGTYNTPDGVVTISDGGGGQGWNTLPEIPPPVNTATGTGGGNTGIYTGATATPPAGQQGTGPQTPQGDAMLQQLADQTGIPIEQLRQVVPAGMLAGGYSAATIAASPVIQSIINQTPLSQYRTAPAGDSKFGQIQAFGVPLGNYRGGQDLNASNFLTASPSDQGQLQGAIEATGAYWPDELKRMLKTSAVSNYATGSFGKQRF